MFPVIYFKCLVGKTICCILLDSKSLNINETVFMDNFLDLNTRKFSFTNFTYLTENKNNLWYGRCHNSFGFC